MLRTSKKLIKLPVFTQSGQLLGRLADFNIDTESQSVFEYLIDTRHTLNNLFDHKLIINRGQIVDILPDKIVVLDNSIANRKLKTEPIKKEPAALPALEKNN
ncbi:MAG TPA: PRC-barrel domain-containing protein [bacterium]|nr:PRC-barrel domain-containing protein [bacterium]